MCQLTGAKPVRVHGIGAKLWAEADKQNYGHLHVTFDDGSVGWYEAGWGPMMSETAYFVKDVVGPKGAVSIVAGQAASTASDAEVSNSADIDRHTKTDALKIHYAQVDGDKNFSKPDEIVSMVTDSLLKTYADSDALDLVGLVRGGQVSPAELVEAAITLVERLNPALNAVIHRLYDMTCVQTAATFNYLETVIGRPVTSADVEAVTWAIIARGRATSGVRHISDVEQLRQIGRDIVGDLDAYDLFITPTLTQLPRPLGYYDMPAIASTCKRSSPASERKMPC